MNSIIIYGISGRMGKTLYETAKKHGIKVVCGIDKNTDEKFGCPVYKSFENVKERADVIIDFSAPNSITDVLSFAKKNKIPVVIATTGHDGFQSEYIESMSEHIPVLKADNTSKGIKLLTELAKITALSLENYDIEIIEKHRLGKKDAPSGTALTLFNAINNATDGKFKPSYYKTDDLQKEKNEICIHSLRGGNFVGEHEIIFFGENECISVKHTAFSKELFAEGALKCAEYIYGKPDGLYSVNDMD